MATKRHKRRFTALAALILRELEHEGLTSLELAARLGVTQRYTNQALRYLHNVETTHSYNPPEGRQVFIEEWREIIRDGGLPIHIPVWRKGRRYDKRKPPPRPRAKVDPAYYREYRARKSNK